MPRFLVGLVAIALACGGSNNASRTSSVDDPARCPPPPLDQSYGSPCANEGMSCRAEACPDAEGFCNMIVCQDGAWLRVEVPTAPPPPP